MAQITGQAGKDLSAQLAAYLSANQGNLTSEQLANTINNYLTGGDKLGAQGGTSVVGGIYKTFQEYDQISGKVEVVTTGIWSGDTGSLGTFLTSSTQTAQEYYTNVYDTDPTTSGTIQFAIAYGNRVGSGSISLQNDDTSTIATKAIYAQYRSILLDTNDNQFTFVAETGSLLHNSDDIYVINVARARYRESMDAGNWSIDINGVTFIDDSGKKFSDTAGKAGRVFNIAEGNLNLGSESEATVTSTTDPTTGQGYGVFYPDMGLIVFNPTALESRTGMVVRDLDVDTEGYNSRKLYDAIVTGGDFQARRTENISTAHYFVRATNREYNYSNNPTFVTGSDGTFVESSFERDPKTYITTVGLYNGNSEMLAVAKTSQPIPKSFDKEILIKVKLDF